MDWHEKKIDAIARDRSHGAAQLATSAIKILLSVCKRCSGKDLEQLLSAVRQTALSLAKVRPSMAAIRNWSLVFSRRFQEKISDSTSLSEAQQQGVLLGEELLAQQQRFVELQVKAARNPFSVGSNWRTIIVISLFSFGLAAR